MVPVVYSLQCRKQYGMETWTICIGDTVISSFLSYHAAARQFAKVLQIAREWELISGERFYSDEPQQNGRIK